MIGPGDDLGGLIVAALDVTRLGAEPGDVIAVCQKVVSKAEGRLRLLSEVTPSPFARQLALQWDKDARLLELVLSQARRIVRMDRGLLIAETGPGWVCANAGVDESNGPGEGWAVLLPHDPDASAARIRAAVRHRYGVDVAVLVTDTFGRPWRQGLTEVCLGLSGLSPLLDLRGEKDLAGRELHHTVIAVADELAAAAGLLMRKASAVPAVLIRGYRYQPAEASARALVRGAESDLFR